MSERTQGKNSQTFSAPKNLSIVVMSKTEMLYLLAMVRQVGIRVWDYSDHVCERLLNSIYRLIHTQPNFSMRDVAQDFIEDCGCFDELLNDQVLEVIVHIWTNMETAFDCETVLEVYSYFTLENSHNKH